MQAIIDLEKGAVVAQLAAAGTKTNGNTSAVDMNNGDLSTNAILDIGDATSGGSVQLAESDDQSTWSNLGDPFTITASTSTNTIQVKRVLRTKRYVRATLSGQSGALVYGLVLVAQKKYG